MYFGSKVEGLMKDEERLAEQRIRDQEQLERARAAQEECQKGRGRNNAILTTSALALLAFIGNAVPRAEPGLAQVLIFVSLLAVGCSFATGIYLHRVWDRYLDSVAKLLFFDAGHAERNATEASKEFKRSLDLWETWRHRTEYLLGGGLGLYLLAQIVSGLGWVCTG